MRTQILEHFPYAIEESKTYHWLRFRISSPRSVRSQIFSSDFDIGASSRLRPDSYIETARDGCKSLLQVSPQLEHIRHFGASLPISLLHIQQSIFLTSRLFSSLCSFCSLLVIKSWSSCSSKHVEQMLRLMTFPQLASLWEHEKSFPLNRAAGMNLCQK